MIAILPNYHLNAIITILLIAILAFSWTPVYQTFKLSIHLVNHYLITFYYTLSWALPYRILTPPKRIFRWILCYCTLKWILPQYTLICVPHLPFACTALETDINLWLSHKFSINIMAKNMTPYSTFWFLPGLEIPGFLISVACVKNYEIWFQAAFCLIETENWF